MNRSRHRRPSQRDGFTIVELLVAMTVTMILILALAQAFAVVGEAVAAGRATIEMTSNLRMVANQLQRDLQGITVPVRTRAEDGAGGGYFEIADGPATDKDWDADGVYELNQDRNGNSVLDVQETPRPQTTHTEFGDVDDIIAFTTRNAESPFFGTAYQRGNGPTNSPFVASETGQSTLAEVVWWIQYQDLNDSGTRESGETYMIHRRAMMIRPDLVDLPIRLLSTRTNYTENADGTRVFTFGADLVITRYTDGRLVAVYSNGPAGLAMLRTDLFDFYNNNDVSVRLIWSADASGVTVRLACNSLADLTKRESRYAHVTILYDRPSIALGPMPSSGQFPFLMDRNRRSVTSLYRNTKHGANLGEDVMVSDALAFDVQVFDPNAPLLNWDTGDALVPSDPAYFPATWTTPPNTPPTNSAAFPYTIGYGAFVDLGYGARFHSNVSSWSTFSSRPTQESKHYVPSSYTIYDYCTWSAHYERNGVDEDGTLGADQGTNGFDDETSPGSGNYVNGVDDVSERETLPPYPVPLRGIQVRIRAWDPDSRQIRQATVVSDFVPE